MDPRIRAMLPLFAAVFIDLFSFGLMYPVIVELFRLPVIEALYPPSTRALYLALAFSLFPFGMFFGAALLGDISDAYGRRRTLLICMAGLAVSYLLMLIGVASRVLVWFLGGRLLSGLMAGTSPIAQAAMMDRSTDIDRGANMSHIVLVNCLALVSGPMIGGVLAHLDFRAPLGFAIVLCVIAFAWIHAGVDSLGRGHGRLSLSWHRPFELFLQAWERPSIRHLAIAFFLFQFGFALYYIYIQVRMAAVYGFTPARLGVFSAMLGVGFVVGTMLFYPTLRRRLGNDVAVSLLALLLSGLMIVVTAAPLSEPAQWLFGFLAAVCNPPAYVGLLALISGAAGADEQGWALGIGAAMTAASFFLSGLFASALGVVPVPLLLAAGGIIVALGALPLRAEPGGLRLHTTAR